MNQEIIIFKNVIKKFLFYEDRTLKDFLPKLFGGKNFFKNEFSLKNLSFTIKKGEGVAFVGKNGAGKSTILKLIAGVTSPTSGHVAVKEKVAPLIELGAGFHHELTGLENIYLNAAILGLTKEETNRQLNNIIEFSELKDYMNMAVKRYSSGMYMRLAFAIAIHTNADILLIDEVFAVGDLDYQRKCLTYLQSIKKDKNKTIILVSHDEKIIRQFCDRAIYIADGQIILDDRVDQVLNKYHLKNQKF